MAAGWNSDLPEFGATPAQRIRESLESFVRECSIEQLAAWGESIPLLQQEAAELLQQRLEARKYGTILEYTLPYDGRRPDAILLAEGAVLVLEFKGKDRPGLADLDQVAAYARDLRAYHRDCHNRPVHPVLVPTRASGVRETRGGVTVSSPDRLDEVVAGFAEECGGSGPDRASFLGDDAYCPLPSLVQAARELFHSGTLREVWRARASTEPAVEAISAIAHEAARTRSRHLVLVTGVPGAGKTLVGMRAVHAHWLDDLSVARGTGKPTAPGLYLTGNGPLAEVLQYELRSAGGGGRTFVRHIKSYLDRYVPHESRIPAEHLLVFDEAQRAFSPEKVLDTHKDWKLAWVASEPELFVRVCDRMPEWSVLVGLIGGGQEIHLGEEEGLVQWRKALEASGHEWTVHAPASLEPVFDGSRVRTTWVPTLNLNTELRFHGATRLHDWVECALVSGNARDAARAAEEAKEPGHRPVDGVKLYLTRDLSAAKQYLHDRYAEAPQARYGILASSRDRDLPAFGIANDYMATKQVKIGPWFAEDGEHPSSCRRLEQAVTEFGCQGLELDMALVAWGSDLLREDSSWTTRKARRYKPVGRTRVRNSFQMRLNAYRVLMTRGRDGTVVFVPALPELDETYAYLGECGLAPLE